jgi:hypothetical protein
MFHSLDSVRYLFPMTDRTPLTPEARELLRLIKRSEDTGEGWRQVNAQLWPHVLAWANTELTELDHKNKQIRLTPEGYEVLTMTDPTNRPPLWEVMDSARFLALNKGCNNGVAVAAELRAIAKWVENEAAANVLLPIDLPTLWRVAGLLHAEADRAEAGE